MFIVIDDGETKKKPRGEREKQEKSSRLMRVRAHGWPLGYSLTSVRGEGLGLPDDYTLEAIIPGPVVEKKKEPRSNVR